MKTHYFLKIFSEMERHALGEPCDCVLVINQYHIEEMASNPELAEAFQTIIQDVKVRQF
jgi:hypothetical protein